MSSLSNKTSLKVPYQLPEFIRSDTQYQTFVSFIQAYYEWMEQSNAGNSKVGVTYGSHKLLDYMDVDFREDDETYNRFINYFLGDFMPNFPQDTLSDKSKAIKLARELYKTKGTPSSYKFLFRALYNSDVEIFETRDSILKASDGKWYVSKSLRLDSNDESFLIVSNYRAFGETSKSIATIERAVTVGNKIELYISNIERLFQSGENIKIVDNRNQTVYFKDGEIVSSNTTGAAPLTAKILGSISSVQIDPKKRGQLYVGRTTGYSGDPVVFYGGLNFEDGVGAKAFVSETTAGSIRAINVLDGSHGYREDPNTYIKFAGGGGSGAIANVGSVDPTGEINVAFIPKDFLSSTVTLTGIDETYSFFNANTSADVNCSLANAFTFTQFSTYPISTVIVNNGGGGFTSLPTITAKSLYDTTDPQPVDSLKVKADLASLGILGPISIDSPGSGYSNGDAILFNGGTGYGANANVTVNEAGSIVSVQYNFMKNSDNITLYPKGGLGYKNSNLPTLTVSGPGIGAMLSVSTVLGDGADLEAVPDERGIGAITSILVEEFGEDYITAPNVSLRVRDLVVSNVSVSNIVKKGEIVYQGPSYNSSVFNASVDSIELLQQGDVEANSLYLLRTYNYTSTTKTDQQLKITDRALGANLYLDLATSYSTFDSSGNYIFRDGVRTYGNGAARATAKFLSGLIIGQGQYINDDGFPSSYQILENEDYNNYTYQLKVQKAFSAYESILYKLLHPAGTRVLPVNTLKSQEKIDIQRESWKSNSHTLGFYTGDAGSSASMYGSLSSVGNNIIKFNSLVGSNLETYLFPSSKISLETNYNINVFSEVVSVNAESNTAVLKDSVFLGFANVAYANTLSSNDRINILSITDQFDLVNNGEYSDANNKLKDLVFIGDTVRVYANTGNVYTGTVSYVSYANGTIFVTSAPTFSTNTGLVSISRNVTTTDVHIYNTLGTSYYPELVTEAGEFLTTEDNRTIVLG